MCHLLQIGCLRKPVVSVSSQFSTSPTSGREYMASGSETTMPGHPGRTESGSGTAPAATSSSSQSALLQPSSSSGTWSSSCGGIWRLGPGSSHRAEPPISAASYLRSQQEVRGAVRATADRLNALRSTSCDDPAVPTCFVGVGHGVQSDVVEFKASVLVKQGAKLTNYP